MNEYEGMIKTRRNLSTFLSNILYTRDPTGTGSGLNPDLRNGRSVTKPWHGPVSFMDCI